MNVDGQIELVDLKSVRPADVIAFSCGNEDLDRWLHEQSAKDCSCGLCKAYACIYDGTFVGFFTLSPTSINALDVSSGMRGGITRLPIPAYIIGRLGTRVDYQGKGIGGHMLLLAMGRACEASQSAGGRLLYIEAKSQAVASWYEHHGFTSFPSNPLRLVMKLSKARRLVQESGL